ncbi:endonuclease/exonuclease/phosphatase family protein [Verrucomicrobiales bacterium]|nr:endonuclease/exonuclease/phosphatase family protein [Verrucomicrobiales bacterium]MDB4358608.1 endonuclease/exonuclease/phosphatase family protein [Verrucomicrobiales bacterium]|tara:strand:- start:140 stop:949 length:810 start_codon:yes stop_codon:yes gene_type:complete
MMKLPKLGIALLLLCFTWLANGEESKSIRVLCYNIHFGQGNDKVYDVERLAKVIEATKPDLVALQEIDVMVERSGRVHQIRELGKLTGMASRYGPTQHYQGGLYGNGVLSRLPILDVVIYPLPYTEATPEKTTYPRAAIAVTVEAPDGKPLRFVSTHFQHNVEEDRVAQAKEINRLFVEEEESPIRTILAGDMNSQPDAEPMSILLKHWDISDDGELAPTAPATAPRSRIDYILTRKGDKLSTKEAKVIDEKMASDHLPVFSVIELTVE